VEKQEESKRKKKF